METVKFLNYECSVEVKSYGNGRTALQLVSAIDDFEEGLFIGNPIALATVNVPEMDLGSDSVFIKNYSENKGILDVLKESGWVTGEEKVIPYGHVDIIEIKKGEKLLALEESVRKEQQNQKKMANFKF